MPKEKKKITDLTQDTFCENICSFAPWVNLSWYWLKYEKGIKNQNVSHHNVKLMECVYMWQSDHLIFTGWIKQQGIAGEMFGDMTKNKQTKKSWSFIILISNIIWLQK